MKYVLKTLLCTVLVMVMAVGLTACGNKVGDIEMKEGESAIYIDEDGTVSYGVSEKFAEDYYNEDDLQKKIDAEIEDYNNGKKASVNQAITLEKFKVSDKVATLILDFATVYDFNEYVRAYNNEDKTKFYTGTIADNDDCKIKGSFVSPDKSRTATAKEIKAMTKSNIIIVNDKYKVQLDSDIKYVSENCTVNEEGIVTTAGAEQGLSYIIY